MIRHALRVVIPALAFMLICALPAQANYAAGKRAWDAGRPAEALREWRAAANSGDRRAMLALGRLFMRGVGAPQDYVVAHMWFNLAAGRGEMEAVKERDALAAKMTPQQVASAQERARSWRPGGEKRKSASASPPPRAIREAKELLAALGYKPGTLDGRWNERTAKAYAGFLRDAGLPPGDTLTPSGLRAMRAAAKGRRAGNSARVPSRPKVRPDALHRAVLAGNVDGLKAALAAGADVNARDARGWTALMHAANKGYASMVESLIEAKAKVDERAADGATALFMAAVHGYSEVIELLMKGRADPSIKGPKGKSSMDVARRRYGTAEVARGKGEGPGVLALLAGKTWAQVEAAEDLKRRWPKGKVFRDCPECPEMVVVPYGSFMMGSSSWEYAGPRHRVTIPKPFAIGKHEVTRREFGAFVRMTGRDMDSGCYIYDGKWKKDAARSWRDPGFSQTNLDPVVCVNWDDAKAYVAWLSDKTGERYRLLSEAEWEYAARGWTRTSRYWGDDTLAQCTHANGADGTLKKQYSNWRGGHGVASCRDGFVHTAPAGSFSTNGFGLHDVLGNVWEWVVDCWNARYAGAPLDGRAWTNGDCSRRVLRGGSWSSDPLSLFSAIRGKLGYGLRFNTSGFRVARTLGP